MKASEKLRSMTAWELLHLVLDDWETWRDQFADVVEAAERRRPDGTYYAQDIAAALTALQEHLDKQ